MNFIDYTNSSGGGGAVDSVNGEIGTVILSQDDILDGVNYKQLSTAEKTKLADVELQANKGIAGGYASLDGTGRVPSAQLPSYVDDVVEVANYADLPTPGESSKIYITLDDNKTYRWSGSVYIEIFKSLDLGETSSSAYRGDRGKIGYEHTLLETGNPHSVTKSDVGLGDVQNVDTTTTENITDFTDKRFITDDQATILSDTSNTNTGDETTSSVKSKLGIAATETDGYLVSEDWNIFNMKQSALTSGTNIKTINNISLLGSGNITISGGEEATLSPDRKAILLGTGTSMSGYNNQAFLMADNTLKSCGDRIYNGSNATRDTPSTVAFYTKSSLPTIVKVFSGIDQTYLLDSVGMVWVYGDNTDGCLGLGNVKDTIILTKIAYFETQGIIITDIVPLRGAFSDAVRSCFFLTSLGRIYATGSSAYSSHGNNSTTRSTVPIRCGSLEGMTNIAVSAERTAVFAFDKNATGHNLYVWGCNEHGQLGQGDKTSLTIPTLSTTIENVVEIQTSDGSSGSTSGHVGFSVAKKSDGTLYYSGDNRRGTAGQGNNTNLTIWTQIPNLSNITSFAIAGGSYATLVAIDNTKTLRCLGNNRYGLFGNDSQANQDSVFTPTNTQLDIQGNVDEVKIAGMAFQTMLVRSSNRIFVSGWFRNGVRSDGSTSSENVFVEAMGIRGDIAQMEIYTANDGASQWSIRYLAGGVASCGENSFGRCGGGSTSEQYYLVDVKF